MNIDMKNELNSIPTKQQGLVIELPIGEPKFACHLLFEL